MTPDPFLATRLDAIVAYLEAEEAQDQAERLSALYDATVVILWAVVAGLVTVLRVVTG